MQSLAKERPTVLGALLNQIYGGKITPEKQRALTEAARQGTFPLPPIELVAGENLVDRELLRGGIGASSVEEDGAVFLCDCLTKSPELLVAVLIEEAGHYLDRRLGGGDTAGDEGQMFLVAVAKGDLLTQDEMAMARSERDQGMIWVGGRKLRVEFAGPPSVLAVAVVYSAKAMVATTIDALLEYAIAAITGIPPGVMTHVINLLVNLLPIGDTLSKAKKLKRLVKVLDVAIDTVKAIEKAGIPGASRLVNVIKGSARALPEYVRKGDLIRARSNVINIIGHLRLAQVTSRLKENGARIDEIMRLLPGASGHGGDVDLVFWEGGQRFLGEVKATSLWNSIRSEKKRSQLRTILEQAKKDGARVRYYVDTASQAEIDDFKKVVDDLARQGAGLEQVSVEVVVSADFLN
jgi:hypothetical protein